jgi:hypothetical protein
MHTAILLGVIQAGGVLALRIFGTIALLGFAASGVLIYRRRHQLFDRDPEVLNDTPAVRHIQVEAVVIVWGAIMMALLGVLYEVWRA